MIRIYYLKQLDEAEIKQKLIFGRHCDMCIQRKNLFQNEKGH